MPATNQERLLSLVQAHPAGSHLLDEVLHFHMSVKQKLWSIDYFNGQVQDLKPEVLYQARTQGNTLVLDRSTDVEGFGLYANLLLDGFLMNTVSALDTFAHEVKALYQFHRPPSKVYIRRIEGCLAREHAGRALTTYLSVELAKRWFDTLTVYRHCTTHESLVGANVRFDASLITGDLQYAYVPLPDDPRHRPFTYKSGRELKSYCSSVRAHVVTLIRHSYYCIIQDIKTTGTTLPIT